MEGCHEHHGGHCPDEEGKDRLPPATHMSIASQNNSLPLAFTFTYIYKAAMSEGKEIWKLKIPLKIKIFLWFFQRWILLTKDNLAKKNWTESQKCCECNGNETIEHLFLHCPYARMVWRIIFYATGLTPPRSIRHMFNF